MGLAETSHLQGSSFHKQDTPCKLKILIVSSVAEKTCMDFFLNIHNIFYRIHCRHISSKCHWPMLKIHHCQKESQAHIRKEKQFPIIRLQAVKYVYKLEGSYTLRGKAESCSRAVSILLSPQEHPQPEQPGMGTQSKVPSSILRVQWDVARWLEGMSRIQQFCWNQEMPSSEWYIVISANPERNRTAGILKKPFPAVIILYYHAGFFPHSGKHSLFREAVWQLLLKFGPCDIKIIVFDIAILNVSPHSSMSLPANQYQKIIHCWQKSSPVFLLT